MLKCRLFSTYSRVNQTVTRLHLCGRDLIPSLSAISLCYFIAASVLGYQYSSDDDNEQGHGLGGASAAAGADFSPEEIKAFEQENEDLYDDLMSLKDNVQQIQSRVVEITKLQEVREENLPSLYTFKPEGGGL